MQNDLDQEMVCIAEHEGRSLTRQMIHLMQDCVRQFEKAHGPIDPAKED